MGNNRQWYVLPVLILIFSFSMTLRSQSLTEITSVSDCDNKFSTELVSMEENGDCITFTLNITVGADNKYGLSHYTVAIPCGTVSNVISSENWAIENPSSDPTTGLSGFKIDEISGFGEDGIAGSFSLEYTVCSEDSECLNALKDSIYVAYKAATCVFYESIYPVPGVSFDASVYHSDVSCYGGNNGSAGIEIVSGTPPYSFEWSNGSTLQDVSGLRAGEYSVVVTDSTGESLSFNVEISQPEAAISIEGVIVDASCGANDGSISTSVSGGTAPYTYLWNDGDTLSEKTQLYLGTYVLTVMDSLGCTARESFDIESNTDLTLSLIANVLECYQDSAGEVVSSVQGGVEPYSYYWSSGDTTKNLAGVSAGSYSLEVTDASGCSVTANSYVSQKALSLSTSVVNPTCYGGDDGEVGVANVYYGTEPYSYLWSTGDTTSYLADVSSGRYKVTVTDANGCEVSRNINLADRQQVSLSYTVSARDCDSQDSIEVNLVGTGGMPDYTYYLGEQEVGSSFKTDTTGTYAITVIDALGCENTQVITLSVSTETLSVNADVSQPACGGASTGAASLTVSGGTEPYTYVWSDGSQVKDREDLSPGSYSVQVLDVNGCYASTGFTIDEANIVTADIVSGSNMICDTDSMKIYASHSGGADYSWEIISDDLMWYIQESSIDSLVYHSGAESATFVYSVLDEDGCMATDTLTVSCSIDNSETDSGDGDEDNSGEDGSESDTGEEVDDTTDSGSNDDAEEDDYYFGECFGVELESVVPKSEDDCYKITIVVTTDGSCEHELSHMVVGLEDGYVDEASNTEGWKMELNITDPTTGVYGFKVDEISGFGQNGQDVFEVEFTACFSDGLPDYLPIAFKAANGYEIKTLALKIDSENNGLEVNIYPNPFKDNVNINVLPAKDTNVRIEIFDIYGNKVQTLFDGEVNANVTYTFEYDGEGTNESVLFYKIYTDRDVVEGKLLRVK